MTNKNRKNFDVIIAVSLMIKEEQKRNAIMAHNNKIIAYKTNQGVNNA